MAPRRRFSECSETSTLSSQYRKHKIQSEELSEWFNALGLYRKFVARNESCIFRAVADTRYLTQSYFSWVQSDLLIFTEKLSPQEFELFSQQAQIDKEMYVTRLRNPLFYKPSLVDLCILSNMYGYNFKLYTSPDLPPIEILHSATSETIQLYTDLHKTFDLLYTEERYRRLAFCQHIIYEIYYKNVFKLEDIDYAVQKMLCHDSSPTRLVPGYAGMDSEGFIPNLSVDKQLMPLNVVYAKRFEMRAKCPSMKRLLEVGITPFPFKVAKALHPDIYRFVFLTVGGERIAGGAKPPGRLETMSSAPFMSCVQYC